MNNETLRALMILAFAGVGALLYANHTNNRKRIDNNVPNTKTNTGFRFAPAFEYDPFKDFTGETQIKKVERPVDDSAGQIDLPRYNVPTNAFRFLSAIQKAEKENQIPPMLLARLLQQESGYRKEVIDGSRLSPRGAMGIAQVMPATAIDPGFGVPPLRNPLDPYQAIPWAARYLKAMYRTTGAQSWQDALAAYNWGPGNVKNNPRSAWPGETRNYVAQIVADVPVS